VAEIQNQKFSNQVVELDGNSYNSCSFIGSTLVYSGGGLPRFVNCAFGQNKVELKGGAGETQGFLTSLYAAGLTAPVNRVLDGMMTGQLAFGDKPAPPPALNMGTNYRPVGITIGVMVAVTLVFIVGLWYGFVYYPTNVGLSVTGSDGFNRPLISAPILQAMPDLPADLAAEFDQLHADELARLDSYGWVDEDAALVHVPISEAMEMMLAQELPIREAEE
jgi:hypothetical protein